ncbi:hypothetical protein LCGC14_0671540 [marine sediment metagenome]|uniref:Uncharacterized protein n=1 Tax=marine sediment metagenome TaxID=412755 RepID=A0A0F9QQT2_9ZZZZ
MSAVCDRILKCPGWEKNEPKLASQAMLAWIYGQKYDGDLFKYCPWCGKEITWRSEAKEEENKLPWEKND